MVRKYFLIKVNTMRFPNKLRGADQESRIEYAIARLKSRYHFHPGKKYNLLVRKPHDVPGDHPEYSDDPGQGLLKRNEHWERVTPLRKIKFPREKDTARGRMSIDELRNSEMFKQWFQERFPDLPDGVYGAVQRAGKGNGYSTLFLLEYRNGKVAKFQKKSKSQRGSGVGENSEYFALPWYFHIQKRVGVMTSNP